MNIFLRIKEEVKTKHFKQAERVIDHADTVEEIHIVRNLQTGKKMMKVMFTFKGEKNMATIANPY